MLYVIVLLVRKEKFYLKSQFITLLMKNQEILMFKSRSVIIVVLWKMYSEASNLVLVCMDMTPSLMETKRIFLRVTSMKRDIKDLQILLE